MADKTSQEAMSQHLAKIQSYLDRLQEKVNQYNDSDKITWPQVGDMGYVKEELKNVVKFSGA